MKQQPRCPTFTALAAPTSLAIVRGLSGLPWQSERVTLPVRREPTGDADTFGDGVQPIDKLDRLDDKLARLHHGDSL